VDLAPTEDERAFRAELRSWLEQNKEWDARAPRHDDLAEEFAFLRDWQRKLASGRWVGVTWPEEYGGRGLGPVEHAIAQEEFARAGAPELVGRIGVNLAGPTLLAHGTQEQKTRWLPHILDASVIVCQLFSEPGAGSDLASVKTKATRVEGGWSISGQKVWTSYAQFADWGVCLARTNPDVAKQKGITYFVVDMHADGVNVRPLVQMTGEAEFNEVFLDNVFVPDDQVIGDVDNGWRIANSTLSHERGINPRQLVIHTQLCDDLVRRAATGPAYDDPRIRQQVAESYVEVRLFQLQSLRTLSRLARGAEPGPEGSGSKLYWSQMSQRMHDVGMKVLGPDAAMSGAWQRSWLYYRAASIWAGTNEIQRNIVGERVLGLPKEPAP
jgi:alkylation response protein AidB-like acyl-CoA dehydrogenase